MGWAGEALKARPDARSLEWVVQEGSLQTGGPSGMNPGQHKASHGGAGRSDRRDSLRSDGKESRAVGEAKLTVTGMGRPEGSRRWELKVVIASGQLGSGLWRTAEWSGHVQGALVQRWPCPGARLGEEGTSAGDQNRLGKPMVGSHLTRTQNIFQV